MHDRYGNPRRRPLRLRHCDYTRPGAYFVTVCTHRRACLFGRVVDGAMHLNAFGTAVETCWRALPGHYSRVGLDGFVVMPNHVHGVLVLAGGNVAARSTASRHGLSEIVRAFKTFSSRCVNELRGSGGARVWQRGFYEHVVRKEESLDAIRRYIETNPLRWDLDRENPENARFPRCTGGFETRPYSRG